MRIISTDIIATAMINNEEWKVGLKLWFDVFNNTTIQLSSPNRICDIWKEQTRWPCDYIRPSHLLNTADKRPMGLYAFSIGDTDCRLLVWISIQTRMLYVKDILSCTEYKKWYVENIVESENLQANKSTDSSIEKDVPDLTDLTLLANASNTLIINHNDYLERLSLIDELFQCAKSEIDLNAILAHAIGNLLHAYEQASVQIPMVKGREVLAYFMKKRGMKQTDLKHITHQSVVSEILNSKRRITEPLAEQFSQHFKLPVHMFVV